MRFIWRRSRHTWLIAIATTVALQTTAVRTADGDGSPGGRQAGGSPPCPGCGVPLPPAGWDWGEILVAPVEYRGLLTLRNECDVPSKVTFELKAPYIRFPYLSDPPEVTLNAGESREVHAEVKLTTPPCRIIITTPGHTPYPPFGGSLRLSYQGEGERCLAKTEEYPIVGTLVFPKVDCETAPAPEKMLTTDPCVQWWLTGERPQRDGDPDAMCLSPIRELAAAYRERALDPIARSDPDRWQWLPTVEAIRGMTIAELLAMKARAEALIKEA